MNDCRRAAVHCVAAECERAKETRTLEKRNCRFVPKATCGNADLIYFFRRIKRQYFNVQTHIYGRVKTTFVVAKKANCRETEDTKDINAEYTK